MLKTFALILIGLVLAACEKSPVSTSKSSNPEVTVALLFEHDGCRIYRFTDVGKKLYYAQCQTGMVRTFWNDDEPNGKSSTPRPMEVATERR